MEFVKKKVNIDVLNPFITSPTNKVIHTQTKLQQKPKNCLSVFDHSMGLARKGFTASFCKTQTQSYILNKTVQINFQNNIFD